MQLATFAVNSPVKVTMLFVTVLLLGYLSLNRLPTNLFPDIRAPKITTTVKTKGLSPLEVERRICEELERSLYTIRGASNVQTIARADTAVVVTEFSWDTDLDFAFLDVKKAVSDLQRQRSQDIENATVLRFDPNAAPVMTLALKGGKTTDLEDLYRLAEYTLKPRFERIEGVASVVLTGGLEREVLIRLREPMLLTYGLDVSDVTRALQAENVDATGGWVEEGTKRYLLKAMGQFKNLDDVRNVVIVRRGDVPIQLGQIADVELSPKEAKSVVLLDGEPAVGFALYREAEGNTVSVAGLIRKEIGADKEKKEGDGHGGQGGGGDMGMGSGAETIKDLLPAGAEIHVANDQSQFIKNSISEVRSDAVLGGALAILVLLAFLRDIRSTLILATAIPISIVATFNLMYFQGLSLNMMTLGGLAVSVGSLVDVGIVVLDNIYHHRSLGLAPDEAARKGASEIAGAVIASIATNCIVFLPIIYIKGVAALMFKEQGMTVIYSQLASIIVALILIPMLASKFLGKPPAAIARALEAEHSMPDNLYVRALRLGLRFRAVVVLVGIGSLGVAWALLRTVPREFMPHSEQRQVSMRMVMPSGTPIAATRDAVNAVLQSLAPYKPCIEGTYVRIGEAEEATGANTEDPDGPNTADFYFSLAAWDKPTTSVLEAGLAGFRPSRLPDIVQPVVARMEGAKAEFKLNAGSILEIIGGPKSPLTVEISGKEIDALQRLSAEAEARLKPVAGLVNVRTNILQGTPEVLIRLDRPQMARLGLDVAGVAGILQKRIDGEVATQIKREAGDVDLRVKVNYGAETIDTLRRITLKSSTGAMVPLETIAELRVERGPREIVRQRQERVAFVFADFAGLKLSDGIARARAALGPMRLPVGYSLNFTGEEEQRAQAFGKLGFALALSIVLIYMVMASIFESLVQPFLILMTIPLAGVGVVLAFVITHQSLNIMGYIGIVMLGGIVVNNAIVLLDCVNTLRTEGKLSKRDTLIVGCARRLRPVLMTTLTTLLGLVPLGLGLGEGAELRQSMALAVIGGLSSSTLLTLLVIPVCQSYYDSLHDFATARFARRTLSPAAAATE